MPGERIPLKHLAMQQGGPYGNNGGPATTIYAKNTSGGALTRGAVVIMDTTNSTKDQLCFTTTTSANNSSVLGVVFDQSIASNGIGQVQIWGPHDSIAVTGAMTVGHVLATSTSAGVAKDAGAPTQTGSFATVMGAASGGFAPGWISRLDFAQQNP